MTTLNVTDIVFQRGEGGSLIPQERTLTSIEGNPTINIIPLTRGKLQEIHAMGKSSDLQERIKADTEVVKIGLIEPKLTDEQIADLKPKFANAIVMAIMAVSLGIGEKEIEEKATEVINQQEEELKKK